MTLDNASNNDTMVESLEKCCKAHGIQFSAAVARMRCLPHTIHLAALQVRHELSIRIKQEDLYLT